MRRNRDLEARLVEWAKEYRGGRYAQIGYASQNILQTLIDHKGFVPDSRGHKGASIRTGADEIEECVKELQDLAHGYRPAMVLRCEFFSAHVPLEARINQLKRVGVNVDDDAYYELLDGAMAHVSKEIGLPFERKESFQKAS